LVALPTGHTLASSRAIRLAQLKKEVFVDTHYNEIPGLAWLLAHKPNILLIPGTANLVHLEENIASASILFDKDVLTELDANYAKAI
jgi:diketogulonate reductase-like aldo/keto reductase